MDKTAIHSLLTECLETKQATMTRISNETGVPYSSITSFKESGYLGDAYCEKLHDWFKENFKKKARQEDPPGQLSTANIFEHIAFTMSNLAKMLQDDRLSLEFRFSHYKSSIEYYLETLPAIEREVLRELGNQDSPDPKHPQRDPKNDNHTS